MFSNVRNIGKVEMKFVVEIFALSLAFSLVNSERFSATEELLSLTENDELLAVKTSVLIESLEKLIANLKR